MPHPLFLGVTTMQIAVLGLGSIGMRHAKNLRALGHGVWGYDTDMSKRLELGFDYTGKPEHLKSADAFVIATPTARHLDDLISHCMYNKPIFIEKPIAAENSPTLQKIVDAATTPIMVGYNLRFHEGVILAKNIIKSGLLGPLIWAQFTCAQFNDRPGYLRDGVVINWSHEIDLALYLLGPIVDVSGSAIRKDTGHEDMVDAILVHANHCVTGLHLDYLSNPECRTFAIQGTKQRLEVNLPGRTYRLCSSDHPDPEWVKLPSSYDEDYLAEMRAFVRMAEGDLNVDVGCSAQEAIEVIKICDKIKQRASE